MNYLDNLVNKLKKRPLSIDEFNHILSESETFFDSIDLEKELLLSNGSPLHFSDVEVSLKTTTTKLKDQTFCIVDIETTSGKVSTGQIIEIGAVKFKNGQIIEKYESLVTANHIPYKIQEITGITPKMLIDAPNIQTVLEEFKIFLEDDIFVAHAIHFDYKFINDSFVKYDLGMLCNRRLCTIDLSKKLIDIPRYGLDYLKKHLKINIDNQHRAYSDALSTTKVLQKCLELLPQKILHSEELIKFSKAGK